MIAKWHRLFSDSTSSRILSDCCSPCRQHKLSDKILLKSLSLFSDKWLPNGIACLAIVVKAREYLAIVLRQVASINFATKYYPNHFRVFSDRWLPKVIACLAIDCRKIASEVLAIRHSQNHKRLFSEFDCQKVIANLAIKERKIAESIQPLLAPDRQWLLAT